MRKIMPLIKESLERGVSIPLHGEGAGYREYLYVKNIPPAIDLLLEKGEGTYNITLGEGMTVQQLIQTVESITGKKVTTHPSLRPGMDMKYQVDAGRMKGLGWKPVYTFEEGLREYFQSTL
jgi:dTDP-D-glucose 4,6-dehydratase